MKILTKRQGRLAKYGIGGGVLLFMIVLSSINVFGFVEAIEYKGIKWKFYGDFEQEECFLNQDIIPEKYWEGMRYVKVFPNSDEVYGYYWLGGSIDLFVGCTDLHTLVHELAHHCQFKRADKLFEGIYHQGHFNECEDEIWESIKN